MHVSTYRVFLCGAVLGWFSPARALAQASASVQIPTPVEELLWPKGAPDATDTTALSKPSVTIFPAPVGNANGAAAVICPGGGYQHLATEKEGDQVAKWLNTLGVSAYVLKYRLSPYHHPVEMHDAQRAMRWARANAKRLGIDTARIGIVGFSAGGHLASTVATHYDGGDAKAADSVDRFSCKPDFQILVYPVITMVGPAAHVGSREYLLGKDSSALWEFLSNEKHITSATGRAFLVHGKDDGTVSYTNSVMYYDSCLKAHVPAELHLFDHGPHGFGLADGQGGAPLDSILATWPSLCAKWMQDQGLFRKTVSLSPYIVSPSHPHSPPSSLPLSGWMPPGAADGRKAVWMLPWDRGFGPVPFDAAGHRL
jgi:acetyl esterase/lipase